MQGSQDNWHGICRKTTKQQNHTTRKPFNRQKDLLKHASIDN